MAGEVQILRQILHYHGYYSLWKSYLRGCRGKAVMYLAWEPELLEFNNCFVLC